MAVTISIIVSLLALLATFYQLHLQRVHNEKSLKPLGQITLNDHSKIISVRVCNNGLGPLIIDRLTFTKGDNIYSSIKECLSLDPRSYMHIPVNDVVKKVVLPNAYLEVFGATLEEDEDEANLNRVKLELSPITLKVDCRDIYDNKIRLERNFEWFSRHMSQNIE